MNNSIRSPPGIPRRAYRDRSMLEIVLSSFEHNRVCAIPSHMRVRRLKCSKFVSLQREAALGALENKIEIEDA